MGEERQYREYREPSRGRSRESDGGYHRDRYNSRGRSRERGDRYSYREPSPPRHRSTSRHSGNYNRSPSRSRPDGNRPEAYRNNDRNQRPHTQEEEIKSDPGYGGWR